MTAEYRAQRDQPGLNMVTPYCLPATLMLITSGAGVGAHHCCMCVCVCVIQSRCYRMREI